MNLGDFHSLVRSAVKRGNSLDSDIVQYSKMAALWLERNYAFKHMEEFKLVQVLSSDRVLSLPTNKIVRSIKFLRFIQDDGRYLYLKRREIEEWETVDGDDIIAYSLVGDRDLVLNPTPTQDYEGEAVLYCYSDWPSGDASTHKLLEVAPDVLLAQTLLMMSITVLRDPKMTEAYKLLRDEGTNTLTRAEDDLRYEGAELQMAYTPEQLR